MKKKVYFTEDEGYLLEEINNRDEFLFINEEIENLIEEELFKLIKD